MKVNNAMESNGYLKSKISYIDLTDNKFRKKVLNRADYSDRVDISEEAKTRFSREHLKPADKTGWKQVLSPEEINGIMKLAGIDAGESPRAEKIMNLKSRIDSGEYDFNEVKMLVETTEAIVNLWL